ncbi:hypothetical protein PspLS_03689 [Pyricularia sp. CBS 133598]|nr:hypothetical protein PspLS_03689 [Pyricularia sp. CBS 133598]
MVSLTLAILSLAAGALGASRTSAPAGCITVRSGASIQQAVNSLSTTASGTQCIFLERGTYREQVLVPARKAQLTIYGYSTDTLSHNANGALITQRKSQKDGLSNDETATLRVKAANFKLYNVNVDNAYGEGSQAVALSAYADSGYYGCRFTGFQDTVLANQGKQLYARCLVQGATDFVFGQYAAAWFEKNDVRVLGKSLGYITANGRLDNNNPSYYVFNNCNVAAASGQNVPRGAYYLGRPWREFARVVFQNTAMTEVVNSAGWKTWNTGDERISNVLFGEYRNSGAGSQGQRASFSRKLGSAVGIDSILGSGHRSAAFYDGSYM